MNSGSFADLVFLSKSTWLAVVPSEEEVNNLLEDLKFEAGEIDIRLTVLPLSAGMNEEEIRSKIDPSDSKAIAFVYTGCGKTNLEYLDQIRDAISQDYIVWIVNNDTLPEMSRIPHFMSLFGSNIEFIENSVNHEEISSRLIELQDKFNMTNDQAVKSWKLGQVEKTPILTEWIVLLGRTDLIGRDND